MSASCRMISFSFEAVGGEYLSRMQRLRKGRPSCLFCKWKYTVSHAYGTYIYRERDAAEVKLVSVGLAQARPNNIIELGR